MSSKRQAIREKIAQLEAEERELLNKERPEALKKVLELIAEYEFTASELGLLPLKNREAMPSKPSKASKASKSKSGMPPYYRNPEDHSQVGQKKGPRTAWLQAKIENGEDLRQYINPLYLEALQKQNRT